jgi:hypothetical protein
VRESVYHAEGLDTGLEKEDGEEDRTNCLSAAVTRRILRSGQAASGACSRSKKRIASLGMPLECPIRAATSVQELHSFTAVTPKKGERLDRETEPAKLSSAAIWVLSSVVCCLVLSAVCCLLLCKKKLSIVVLQPTHKKKLPP